jgi:hypothetical protein
MAKWSKEHQAWYDMIRSCHDPKRKQFQKLYGPLGIRVCQEWRTSYQQFLADVGPAPSPTHWLCRPNVLRNFEPGNCEWTNVEVQMRRRTCCKKVSINGKEMTPAEASRLPGMPCKSTIRYRMANGMWSDNPPAKILNPKSCWIEHAGMKLPIYEWAKRQKIGQETLRKRIKAGWPIEVALNPELRRGRSPLSTPPPAP